MAGKSQGQGTDRTFQFSDPAVLAGLSLVCAVVCWATWYFAHKQISATYVYLRYAEIWLLNLLGAFADLPVVSAAHSWVQRMCAPESAVLLCTRDFSTVQWNEISSSAMVFNGVFLLGLAWWCFRMFRHVSANHPSFRFSKIANLHSFVKDNLALYPHLNLVTRLDLTAKSLTDPVFGMSLTSRQYVYRHRLLSGWQKLADGFLVPVLDRDATAAALLKQLGRHWTRSTELTPGETLLFAIVLPRVAATDPQMSDVDFKKALSDSQGMIDWCWSHFKAPVVKKNAWWNLRGRQLTNRAPEAVPGDEYAFLRPNFDLEHPRSIIRRYLSNPVVGQIISKHAYRTTVLYACYICATRLGVFPPADVRWMRFYDRELWYLRSSIGRQVTFAEGGNAVYSHYLYEVKAGYAIVEPQLDKAVNGLETAMRAFLYTEADKQAYGPV